MQTLRSCSLALLVACQPVYAYVPASVTGATLSAPTHATPVPPPGTSGELPSTAEHEAPSAPVPGVVLPFFPFFPIPPIDIGRDGARYQPLSPAYGPGGGNNPR